MYRKENKNIYTKMCKMKKCFPKKYTEQNNAILKRTNDWLIYRSVYIFVKHNNDYDYNYYNYK